MAYSSFEGKTVIITGASSGIGQGAAIEFARRGANLVLGGRNGKQLTETKNECIKAGLKLNQVLWVIGDIADVQVQQQLINTAINSFNQLDVLVNNAGMNLNAIDAIDLKMADFDRIHNVNLRSATNLSLLALPHLIKTKGNIVNVSSVAAWLPVAGNMAYCVSKAAMDMLTKTLAFEAAPHGVRVNSVNPGAIPTNIGRDIKHSPESLEQMRKVVLGLHPLGRVGEIKEVVDSIIFLASERASFVTGHSIAVGGGIDLKGVSSM